MNKPDLSDKIWRFVKVLYFLLSFVGLLLLIPDIWLDVNIGEFLLIIIAIILIFFVFTDILLRLINYISVGSNIGLIGYLFYIKKYYKWMFLISIVVICGGILSFNQKLRQSLISLPVFNVFLSDQKSVENTIIKGKYIKKSELKEILDNTPEGIDKVEIFQSIIDKGYTVEGFNDQ